MDDKTYKGSDLAIRNDTYEQKDKGLSLSVGATVPFRIIVSPGADGDAGSLGKPENLQSSPGDSVVGLSWQMPDEEEENENGDGNDGNEDEDNEDGVGGGVGGGSGGNANGNSGRFGNLGSLGSLTGTRSFNAQSSNTLASNNEDSSPPSEPSPE